MSILVRKKMNSDGTIYINKIKDNPTKDFIQSYRGANGELLRDFILVEALPSSKHGFYIFNNGSVEADLKRNFEKDKELKKDEIKRAKKIYQNRSVPVDINGTIYGFFGGEENGKKYEGALNTALKLGFTSGTIKVEEGLIPIDKANMNKALGLIGQQVYKGWLKEQYYNIAIDNTQTEAELDAIVWEDVRSV